MKLTLACLASAYLGSMIGFYAGLAGREILGRVR